MADAVPPTLPWFSNPTARAWTCAPFPSGAREFHASLPGYRPTPLVELPALAAELGVERLFVKDESARLGLPAFKMLGASWAIHCLLQDRAGGDDTILTLVCATDGNHGRAVARTARMLGHRAHVFVAPGIHQTAMAAIAEEGAEVVEGSASYDDAVARAAAFAADTGALLVQDTAWPGYERVPGWIVGGYVTLCQEADEQLAAAGARGPDLVAVPVGVGSLAQAVVGHYRSRAGGRQPGVLSVEPTAAACLLESLGRGDRVTIRTRNTVMAGLNCGAASTIAWPYLRDGLDAAVAVEDEEALRAVDDLAALDVPAGPCGAAPLAGLRAMLHGEGSDTRRAELGLTSRSVVLLLSTEGIAANPQTSRPA